MTHASKLCTLITFVELSFGHKISSTLYAQHFSFMPNSIQKTPFKKNLTLHELSNIGRSLEADKDQLISALTGGNMLLTHIPKGVYAFEQHTNTEFIFCVDGHIVLETDQDDMALANAGQLIEVSPGTRHRFGAQSDAVIVTLTQTKSESPSAITNLTLSAH
jgi:quercetin dioxygenase-like cupin family protein